MRIRKRYAFMLAILVATVGVVGFHAITRKPPEPYVDIAGRLPVGGESHEVCRDGVVYGIYVTNDGRELEPVTDGSPCLEGRPPSTVARFPRD